MCWRNSQTAACITGSSLVMDANAAAACEGRPSPDEPIWNKWAIIGFELSV